MMSPPQPPISLYTTRQIFWFFVRKSDFSLFWIPPDLFFDFCLKIWNAKKTLGRGKGIVFLFSCKSSFFSHFGAKSIEWMKKLYFFFPATKKKIQLRDRMNEWHVNFYRKKKTHKKHPKIWKKEHTPLLKKIKKNPPDPEWMPHELFLGKKKYALDFFFCFEEKKQTKFWDLIEWLTHQLFREKKIRYLRAGGGRAS